MVRSTVPAFRCTRVIPPLTPTCSHSTPDIQFGVGSSLHVGLYAGTPLSVLPHCPFRTCPLTTLRVAA
ncbi:hypothetical protein B1742_25165 [Enterobacter kobei]|nr:hypothetical protein B1742_25165 [Enterobacter kobei]